MAITCKKTSAPDTACVCRLATKAERAAMSGQTDPKKCTEAIEADASKFAVIGGASTNGDAIAQLKRGVVARPPAPAATTPKDVLKKIDAAKSTLDFSNISDNELKLITDDEIAKMTDVERKILAKLPASPGEATRIHNALAAAKGDKSSDSSFGKAHLKLFLNVPVVSDRQFFMSKFGSAGDVPHFTSIGGNTGGFPGFELSLDGSYDVYTKGLEKGADLVANLGGMITGNNLSVNSNDRIIDKDNTAELFNLQIAPRAKVGVRFANIVQVSLLAGLGLDLYFGGNGKVDTAHPMANTSLNNIPNGLIAPLGVDIDFTNYFGIRFYCTPTVVSFGQFVGTVGSDSVNVTDQGGRCKVGIGGGF